jgi:transcriptional regulator with XRE-family HTH domain
MPPPPRIGALLRDRRGRQGLTLAALAMRTGLSVSTLSRLENDRMHPGLAQLTSLADAYGCSLDELVRPAGSAVTLPAVTRDGVTFVPLAAPANGLHVFKVSAPPAGPGDADRACAHDGHTGSQWVYVLSGHLRVTLGDREHVLGPGASAEFETRARHRLAGAGGDPVEVLMVFGPAGQRRRVVELGRQWAGGGPVSVG